tara:strand:- start:819 stop:1568 length:750 start_codon:yes stop_codon:yes gene_type:complete
MYFQETGDQEHLDALVKSNIRLAVSIAKKYRRNGIDIEDLTAEAVTGIMRAVECYDVDKGAFSTHAYQWMRSKVQGYVQANCGTLRVGGRAAQLLFSGLQRVRRQCGSDASNEVIAQELGIDVEDVNEILPLINCRAASLDASYYGGGSFSRSDKPSELHNLIPSDQMNQAEAMERTEASEAIAQAIKEFGENLKPIKAAVLHGRILAEYRGQEKAHAESFGVSRERTRQIENELKTKLQDHFKRCGLR